MIRTILLLSVLFFVLSCESKKEGIALTPDNAVEELTAYAAKNPENEVVIQTEYGNMRIRLYDETPLHRANFIRNIRQGMYDDATFYRVFYQFMIQGGIFPKETAYTIPPEFNRKYIHKKGAIAMAQAEDNNPNRESSGSEFFIVHGSVYQDYQVENEAFNYKLQLTEEQKQLYMTVGGYMSLDQQYTVFGEVIDGLDVIDKIAGVKVYEQDKPVKKIPLTISVIEKKNN